ncbi:MAG: SEC-C metal-binding domain-containing protein, partial [Thiohalorhabdaceae bacterium]
LPPMTNKDLDNTPCPCGSGKPFTDCCGAATGEAPSAAVQALREELQKALGDRSFDSPGEANEAMAAHLETVNRRPVDDFQGLSREQMYRVLYHPFDAPELVRFGEGIEARPEAPVMRLFEAIVKAAAEEPGIKLTPKGNLPRAVVADAKAALGEGGGSCELRVGAVRNEEDLGELHTTRLIAGFAGLTRKYKGRLKLTKRARGLLDTGDWGELFRRLLEAYCREFNWAYRDGLPELRLIQEAAVFFLYLLHRYGAEWRPQAFYEQAFLRAFPDVVGELPAEEAPWAASPEKKIRQAWTMRTLYRFGCFFGLLELRPVPNEEGGVPAPFAPVEVRKTPLFDRAVRWEVGWG